MSEHKHKNILKANTFLIEVKKQKMQEANQFYPFFVLI